MSAAMEGFVDAVDTIGWTSTSDVEKFNYAVHNGFQALLRLLREREMPAVGGRSDVGNVQRWHAALDAETLTGDQTRAAQSYLLGAVLTILDNPDLGEISERVDQAMASAILFARGGAS